MSAVPTATELYARMRVTGRATIALDVDEDEKNALVRSVRRLAERDGLHVVSRKQPRGASGPLVYRGMAPRDLELVSGDRTTIARPDATPPQTGATS